jgi:cholesterol transport system auxiliary component
MKTKYLRAETSRIHSSRAASTCAATLLAFTFMFSGCLSRPLMNKQTFAFSVPADVTTNNVTNDHVLGIKTLQIAPPFDSRSLVYRTGEFSYQRDSYAEFLSSPDEELAAFVGETLQENGCFRSVIPAGDTVKPDMMVEINVNQLYGDIRKPGSPAAVIAMQVIFMEAANGMSGRVILQKNYSRQIPMKSATAAALMEGWNQALVEILAEMASDIRSRETMN